MSRPQLLDELETLEAELLALGRREAEAEVKLNRLRERCREAGKAGRADEAETAWSLFEEIRSNLAQTQIRIRSVETRLYALRRRKGR